MVLYRELNVGSCLYKRGLGFSENKGKLNKSNEGISAKDERFH